MAFPQALCVLSIVAGPSLAWADAPLRGNPVDSLPQVERTATPPKPQPAIQAPTPEQQALAARLAQRIVPRNFDITGVHTLPFPEIVAVLEPLANQETSLGELVVQVDKITQLYRSRGYPLSFAVLQNQSFADGLVVVTVVEGYIDSVRIDGDIGNARSRLESLSAPLVEESPLTQATLERQLNLMRMVPGVTITPALDLPKRANGATEMVIAAEHKPVSLTGAVADLGTGTQPLVNGALNSITPLGEQIKLTGSIPFNSDDVKYIAGEASVPIGSHGLALRLDGYHYAAQPSDDAANALGFDRRVKNDRIGVGLTYPLLLNNQRSLTATLGMYAVNSRDRYDARQSDRWLQQNARVRAATTELRYTQVDVTRATDISLGVSHGFEGLGAEKTINTNYGYSATPQIDLDFTRVNLNARQTFQLPAQFGITLAAAAQYSNNVLASSEQVSFGSWRYAMGYPQGEQSGDKGIGASAELNRRFTTGWRYLAAVQPYVLVDYARTWYNAPDLAPLNTRHLSSVALGMRLTDDKYYLFDFNLAKPVAAATVNGNDRDIRFNANYSFFYDAL